MKIRTKLLSSFIAIGILPICGVGVSSFIVSERASRKLGTHAVECLQESSEKTISVVNEIKKAHVLDYFQTAANQVTTLAQDTQLVSRFRPLRTGFERFIDDRETVAMDKVDDSNAVRQFYETTFLEFYRSKNVGKPLKIESIVSKLSPQAMALQNTFIAGNPHPLGKKALLVESDLGTVYDAAHRQVHKQLLNYIETFNFYDLFLVDSKSGDIIYSVFKEIDFATNLIDGPFAKSSLGEAFQRANEASPDASAELVDFAPYLPSYELPASFIAAPIFDGEERLGVLILQMSSIESLNRVMDLGNMLGKGTEAYIVGADFLPRSDSRLDPKNRTIVNAFKNPENGRIRTESVSRALRGESGVMLEKNYLNQQTISSYSPFRILGLEWALIVDQPVKEALAQVESVNQTNAEARSALLFWIFGVMGTTLCVVIPFSLWIIRGLMNPINATILTLKDIAEGDGDLTRRLDETRADELGELSRWFNAFAERIHDLICVILKDSQLLNSRSSNLKISAESLAEQVASSKQQSHSVSAASEQMSVSMKTVSESSESMSCSIKAVAASVEEMNATIREIASNAERSAAVAGDAATLVEESNKRISALGLSANEIGKVIQVIQDIAEQTNLLALNATIEAARAGESGKGFSVVAAEVKELAKQTAVATEDIRARIEAIQESTADAVGSIRSISDVITNVNEVSRSIAAAVEEQSIATKQITDSVAQTATAAESVANGISETALASRELTENFAKVDAVLVSSAAGADESLDAGTQLSQLAHEMSQLVGRFKVKQDADKRYSHNI
ncbi:methyl-accepting chemotaxis protein [Pirellulaceae bacterium SH449]